MNAFLNKQLLVIMLAVTLGGCAGMGGGSDAARMGGGGPVVTAGDGQPAVMGGATQSAREWPFLDRLLQDSNN